MIKQDFDHAVGVHFDYMTGYVLSHKNRYYVTLFHLIIIHNVRDDFRKSIDMNWGWLDGNSLLTIN